MPQNQAELRLVSSEDEKQINHQKMREAFIAALKQKLKQDAALKDWQLSQQLDLDCETFSLKHNESELTVRYIQDGLAIDIKQVNDSSSDAALAIFASYASAHEKFHPKAELEFELTCNDEQEARAIIAKAQQQNITITTLKFYKVDDKTGEDLPPATKNNLLAKIQAEMASLSKTASSKRP